MFNSIITSHKVNESLKPEWIQYYLLSHYNHIIMLQTWGEISFYYNPHKKLPRGIYFFTIKNQDGPHDTASDLNRAGIFRCNFGISTSTFLKVFITIPPRPCAGKSIKGDYNFKELNTLTPHPTYGWMKWVSILNPTLSSWNALVTLIDESYQQCVIKYEKRDKNVKLLSL